MGTQYLHSIHPPTPFPCYISPPTGTNSSPPGKDCSPIVWKKKGKKWHFCLLEINIATQGVSLWYFHVCMYHNTNWFISSIFLHSTLVPFLWWFQTA
jgi:hypothetical protein